MKKVLAQITEKSADEFTAIASSETKDRHGEIVKADGWDLKNFKNNPIILAYHDHTKPIGKATKVWIDKTGKNSKLMFKGFISSATEEARGVKQLMQEGILNAFSVGFMPLDMDGETISKQELHEISVVSVPANADARRLAVKSLQEAEISEEIIEKLIGKEEDSRISSLESELAATKQELASVKDTAEMAVKGLKHLNPLPVEKRNIQTDRQLLTKVIDKAATSLLSNDLSNKQIGMYAKVIKRSSEMLIRSHKGDLNGSTKRTTQKA